MLSSGKIYIYADAGVDEDSLKHTEHSLKELISSEYKIQKIMSDEVKKGKWAEDAALLIMPGGADVPYTEKLDGDGNTIIKKFVEGGGSYLGLCAGGYYGARYVKFDKGGELQVLGRRDLAFFNGTAIGPALKKFSYQSESGASAAAIQLANGQMLVAYQNGGAYFKSKDNFKNTRVIAWYGDLEPKTRAAIIAVKVGSGVAILSGIHFEYSTALLNQSDYHIQKIYPALELFEAERKDFFVSILNRLGINTCIGYKSLL